MGGSPDHELWQPWEFQGVFQNHQTYGDIKNDGWLMIDMIGSGVGS